MKTPGFVQDRNANATFHTISEWEVTFSLEKDAHSETLRGQKLHDLARNYLVQQMALQPGANELTTAMPPYYRMHFRHRAGKNSPDADIHLRMGSLPSLSQAGQSASGLPSEGQHAVRTLPDRDIERVGDTLIGLDTIRDDVLLYLRCRYSRYLDDWSRTHHLAVPETVRERLAHRCPIFLFAGDPGVGKTALASVIANQYCRESNTDGAIISVGTEMRGNGMVGNFSSNLRAAFKNLITLPGNGLRCLILDEAETLAMRRSETQAHQEDRAATNTILQCLDALNTEDRILVIFTTNRAEALDPALRRRCVEEFIFPRPSAVARRQMIRTWLPILEHGMLETAVQQTEGLTPADIERAAERSYRMALRSGEGMTPTAVLAALTAQRATQTV